MGWGSEEARYIALDSKGSDRKSELSDKAAVVMDRKRGKEEEDRRTEDVDVGTRIHR